ncbi:MAG: S41 family peptidase [Armatimonadota bacterium]|nr:PDZ domain-containing protein [bacterium]
MRTIHKIAIGLLVALCFTSGYRMRLNSITHEQAAQAQQSAPVLAPGTQIASVGLQGAANIDFKPIETLYSVVKNLREHYVEQLTPKDEGKMTHDALKVMLGSLNDVNTRFVDADGNKVIDDAQEGKFHGVGAVLGIKRIKSNGITEEHLLLISPIPGGPAAAAGLKAGDDIVAVNGKNVLPFDPYQRANKIIKDSRNGKTNRLILRKELESEQKRLDNGMLITEAMDQLTTKDKDNVDLTVVRKGSPKEIKVKLEPKVFMVEPVASSVIENGAFGYIKINFLGRKTGEQFTSAVQNLKAKKTKGLVLDLRDVAGGEVDSALQVAADLTPGKRLAYVVKSRDRKSSINIPSVSSEDIWHEPLVVLVNSGTARTSELIASVVKDSRAGRLVGETTYGDSAYTTFIEQPDGSAVIMTTGKFLTSAGTDYTGKGIKVDVQVGSGSDDIQLKEAVKLLASGGQRS